MTTDDAITRLADAYYREHCRLGGALAKAGRSKVREAACIRAVLRELREPDGEMVGAGADAAAAYVRSYEAGKTPVEPVAGIIFRSVIDHLLAL